MSLIKINGTAKTFLKLYVPITKERLMIPKAATI